MLLTLRRLALVARMLSLFLFIDHRSGALELT